MNTVNLLMSPKVPLCPLLSSCPQPPSDLLYTSLQFLEGGVPSNIQYVLIFKKIWLLSLSIIILRFTQVACMPILFT